ncbi:putative hydro-lyase [Kushneria aurantia]|uniref:Putative hydro-lyase ACFFHW_11920 n=1 Tax=Kushneria aurantia TaxID=504092 RepID=A0ABV6G6S3_9GAMM|nr:putative hydro-lyase [Kushneria aurantia]
MSALSPAQARRHIRSGDWSVTTAGLANGFAQTNLVAIPAAFADDFLRFCMANRACCPILDVTQPGDPIPHSLGKGIDLRTDLPRYRVYIDGLMSEEVTDVSAFWRDDLVSFSIGCSFSFEEALLADGVPLRHVEQGSVVPMYRSTIPLVASGPFGGSAVVSMRPMPPAAAIRAIQITSDMPSVHGAPLHIARPDLIGIDDLMQPDFGDPPTMEENDIAVFWGCGVTPQAALMSARIPFALTHAPGYMLITDIPNHKLKYR